jgi:hypothetical protein
MTADDGPTFSVLIPLEFHAGQAEACVRGWTRIAYPRARFQLVLAASDAFPERDLGRLRALLGAGDRVLRRPERHDMALAAAAARVADGAALLFTEAHCVPEPDVLAVAARGLEAHSDWIGLSLHARRFGHGRLGGIQADLYGADIAHDMAGDHWCKILDQCFVVRRAPYLAAGGVDPTLGHVAEWMLAARCHRLGLTIGHLPEVGVEHFYAGDLDDWAAFARDFTRGHMTALARGDADGLGDLFGCVPEWAYQEGWRAATARRLARLGLAAGRPDVAARWLPAAVTGPWLARLRAAVRWRRWRRRVRAQAAAAPIATLRASVAAMMDGVVRAERLRVVPAPRHLDRRRAGAWAPGAEPALPAAGFLPPGARDGVRFAWSEPAALVELPLEPGRYDVAVEWLPGHDPAPRFYLNERALPAAACRVEGVRARLTLDVSDAARLAWVCPSRCGLPLTRVTWRPAAGPDS